jgi:ATP-dependent Clp protease ATP-binding subunit ClpC
MGEIAGQRTTIPHDREHFMFERYTEKARRAIFFARYEASRSGSPYIASEHLLLGLLRESKALSGRLFDRPRSAVETIRKQIEKQTTFRKKTSTSVDIPFGNRFR